MLRLNNIKLTQFKNYTSKEFEFRDRVIGICGLNGKGKTNLLDAIYYLCFTRSYFTRTDAQNSQFNSEGFRIEGSLTDPNSSPQKVICIYRNGARKELIHNDSPYEKFSEHIGKFPCVFVAPDDVELISGLSEGRRKFIDTLISQMEPDYLQHLINYNKILVQRNSLLKWFAEQNKQDWTLLDVLDDQIIPHGIAIFERRKLFARDMLPLLSQFYHRIANNEELVSVNYESQLHENSFREILETSRDRDLYLQRTSSGIHKDDLVALLNNRPFKSFASQGQRKSLLFALKLSEFELLKAKKGFAPLLLLDDLFEKLDDLRMKNLLTWVLENSQGQVFITDTHYSRLVDSLKIFEGVQIIQLH